MFIFTNAPFDALMSDDVTTTPSSSRNIEFTLYFAKKLIGLEGSCDPEAGQHVNI